MGKLLNSKIVRYFQNKKLKYEAECINGWIEGVVKTYDSLGNIASKLIYKEGKLNGVCEFYFPNKKVARSLTFIKGEQSGIEKAYHENGNIAFEGQMVNGEKSGEHIYYYSSGNKSAVLHYSFGIRRHSILRDSTEMGYRADGDFFEYFENGSIKYQAKYVNGLPEGLVFANYSKGKEYVENWHKGHIVGKTEGYYENGQLKYIGTYNENGEEIGEWREFYDNGKLRLNIKFDKGKIIEQHYYNYDNEPEFSIIDDLRTILPDAESRY
jgi:antitoxin component YwqK of YwqJK toxin-antitoxin module